MGSKDSAPFKQPGVGMSTMGGICPPCEVVDDVSGQLELASLSTEGAERIVIPVGATTPDEASPSVEDDEALRTGVEPEVACSARSGGAADAITPGGTSSPGAPGR